MPDAAENEMSRNDFEARLARIPAEARARLEALYHEYHTDGPFGHERAIEKGLTDQLWHVYQTCRSKMDGEQIRHRLRPYPREYVELLREALGLAERYDRSLRATDDGGFHERRARISDAKRRVLEAICDEYYEDGVPGDWSACVDDHLSCVYRSHRMGLTDDQSHVRLGTNYPRYYLARLQEALGLE